MIYKWDHHFGWGLNRQIPTWVHRVPCLVRKPLGKPGGTASRSSPAFTTLSVDVTPTKKWKTLPVRFPTVEEPTN